MKCCFPRPGNACGSVAHAKVGFYPIEETVDKEEF